MDWTFTPADAAERRWALDLIFRAAGDSNSDSSAHSKDLLESHDRNQISLDGLFVGRRNSEIVGVGLAILQADRTAHVWAPAVIDAKLKSESEIREILQRLAAYCAAWLDKSDVRLAQCISPRSQRDAHWALQSAGFEALADLVCMHHTLESIPHAPLPDNCEAITYTSENSARFSSVLEQVLAVSQDCQNLQGRRTADECLAAHRLAGQFNPALWQLFHVHGDDVGIKLCADHPDRRMWELLYLGVVPKFRRQGFGIAFVSDMLWDARIAGTEGVLVAVDASNVAAKSLYETCGFEEGFSKQIHIWTNSRVKDFASTSCTQPASLDDTI